LFVTIKVEGERSPRATIMKQGLGPEERPCMMAAQPGMEPATGGEDVGLCCGGRGSILVCRVLLREGWSTERGACEFEDSKSQTKRKEREKRLVLEKGESGMREGAGQQIGGVTGKRFSTVAAWMGICAGGEQGLVGRIGCGYESLKTREFQKLENDGLREGSIHYSSPA
jgi:hypothetical protein